MNRQVPFVLGYRPGLDGLRGLAIILVLLSHGDILGAGFGFIGVNTFFVLSGFLITTLLVTEWDQRQAISFRDFYLRRALRLLPALLLMLTAFGVYVKFTIPSPSWGSEWLGIFWALFYSTNWAQILSLETSPYLGHTWSLSVEEQFYFVWPVLLLILLRKQSRGSTLCWIALGIVFSVALRLLLYAGTVVDDYHPARLTAGLDMRADSLLAGCFIGVWLSSGAPIRQKWSAKILAPCGAAATVGLLVLGNCRPTAAWMVYCGWLLASISAAVLIVSLVSAPAWLSWFYENRVLVYIGRVSYGLYLWHFPILVALREHNLPWLNLAYLLPVSLVVLASYYLVEMPCLRLKNRFVRVSRHTGPSGNPNQASAGMNFKRGFLAIFILFAVVGSAIGSDTPADLIPKLKPVPIYGALMAAAKSNAVPIGQFDSPSPTYTLRPGDSATVLVTFFQKEKQTQWLLYIEAVPPDPNEKSKKTSIKMTPGHENPIVFESEPAPAKLRLLGPFTTNTTSASSKPRMADARISLEKDFLSLGLDQAAALALKWDQTTNAGNPRAAFNPSPAEQRIFFGQFPALFSFVSIVMETEGLNALFFKLVELPSVWSMVRHLGLNLNVLPDGRPTRANPADWNLPAPGDVYYYPWRLELNGKPAVKITLVVTSPHPPLLICSGVVGILAEKADDDQTYMTLRIVNAHKN